MTRTIYITARLLILLLPSGFALSAPSYLSFPTDIDWVTARTAHFDILYRRGTTKLAHRTLNAAERAHRLLRPIFYDGPERTWIVLADFNDNLNGYALNMPYPHMVIFASPPVPSSELAALDDWLESVVLHEYTHTLQLYPAGGMWSPLRSIFGSWVLPVGLMPSHLHEGLAVHFETEFSRAGRGRSALFRMYRRLAVAEGVWGTSFAPKDLYDGALTVWPSGTSPYFFGHYLYKTLWDKTGPIGIKELTGSLAAQWPYLFARSFSHVYHKPIDLLWQETFAKNALEASREIKSIEATPLSELTSITSDRFSKSDLAVSPDGSKIAVRASSPERASRIDILDSKTGRLLFEIPVEPDARRGLCWQRERGLEKLFFLETVGSGGYRTSQLTSYDLKARTRATLHTDTTQIDHVLGLGCPTGEIVTVYRESRGDGTVEQWAWDGNDMAARLVRSWSVPTGAWVASIAGADTTYFALRSGTTTTLYRWSEPEQPQEVLKTKANLYSMAARGERSLYTVADFSGRNEVWRLDLADNSATKQIAVLGGINGFAEHIGQWWVTHYRHGGYDVALAKVALGSERISIDDAHTGEDAKSTDERVLISAQAEYRPWSTLAPTGWIPSLFIVPSGVQAGALIPGFDIAQRHYYSLFGGYDSRGAVFADLNYQYRFAKSTSSSFQAYYYPSYIISTGTFLKQWGTALSLSASTDFVKALGAGGWNTQLSVILKQLEPFYLWGANRSVGLGLTLSRSWGYRKRPIDIAPSSGTGITLDHQQFFKQLRSTDNYYSTKLALTQHLATPWSRQHILYANLQLGLTEGTTLLNSYYQGGGELIFSQGRSAFLNRGFLPGTFFARRIANLSAEYRFPIARIDRGYGYWPLFLKRIHGAVVADLTTAGINSRDKQLLRHYYPSVGVELKSDWTASYYMPASARIGFYRGFGSYRGQQGEKLYTTLALEASL